jgi:hypothetical protein
MMGYLVVSCYFCAYVILPKSKRRRLQYIRKRGTEGVVGRNIVAAEAVLQMKLSRTFCSLVPILSSQGEAQGNKAKVERNKSLVMIMIIASLD